MQDSTPAIVYEGIEKNFGSLKVLQGISGSINRGEVVAVIGSSGCGKVRFCGASIAWRKLTEGV